MKEKYLKEASVGLAVMDGIPVLLFCGTVILLGQLWNSPMFILGGILSVAAGAGKVLWKLILAVAKKNILFLNRQFRYVMSGGFLLMLLSLPADHKKFSWAAVWKNVSWFPGNICLAAGICGMIVMGILAVKMDHSSKKANWLEQSVNLASQLLIFLCILLIWYGNDCYHADADAKEALQSTDRVEIKETENGLWFDGKGKKTALIFYPGAKVEYISYAPLLRRLAEDGVDCFLPEMPYNLAIFGKNCAKEILEEYTYDKWYLAGHSLGGAMAADYAADHPDKLDGLVLLAAYPAKQLSEKGLKVLSVYGSEDHVLNMEKFEKRKSFLPADAAIYCIDGGNHAGFGSYGSQKNDGEASISREEQQEQTAALILEMIG